MKKTITMVKLALMACIFLMYVVACAPKSEQQQGEQQQGEQQAQNNQEGRRQGPPSMGDSSQLETIISELDTQLILSDDQKVVLHKLYEEHFQQIKEKMEAGRVERSEMDELKENFQKKMMLALNSEQQEKYSAFVASHRPPHRRQPEQRE